MRRTLVGISVLALGALVTGACGGDSDGGISGGKSIPIEELGAVYGDALCGVYEKCSEGAPLEAFLNGEDCRKNFETSFEDELVRIKTAIDDGRVVYKADLVQGCIDAVKAASCGINEEPAECKAAFVGTAEDGSDCSLDGECKGDSSYCRVEASCPGKCAPKEPAGASCRRGDDCATGLECSDTTDKCFKPAADGEACGGGSAPDCGPWLYCLGEDEDAQQPGKCADSASAFAGNDGDACWVDGNPLCKDGLHCVISADATAGKLVGKCGKAVAAGAACSPALPDQCPLDEFCMLPPNTFEGTCTKKPGANEPCGAGLGDNKACASDTRCDGGTCRPKQKLGGSCGTDEVCYSENCSDGACAPGGGCTN